MPNTDRIAAAPFRSHLIHECSTAGVPWAVAALHADLPLALVRQLLDVRPGRRVERITPELARRVLALDAHTLTSLDRAHVPAAAARKTLLRLFERGWSASAVARHLHLTGGQVAAIAAGGATEVTRLSELRLAVMLVRATAMPRRPPTTRLAA